MGFWRRQQRDAIPALKTFPMHERVIVSGLAAYESEAYRCASLPLISYVGR